MFDADAYAGRVLGARRARQSTGALPGAPATADEAIAAQVALARRLGAWPPAGFKVGATARAMQAYLRLDGPLASFMAEADLHGSGSTIRWDGLRNPGAECELAVVLARPLPGPCTPAEAAAAVGEVMPAIEIVENRGAGTALPMLADGVFHRAAFLGEPWADWRGMDLHALPGRMVVNGAERGRGVGADLLGGPMECLAWLAGSAEARAYGGLQAGQVVMLGSVCPPAWLDGPAHVAVEFGGRVVTVELV